MEEFIYEDGGIIYDGTEEDLNRRIEVITSLSQRLAVVEDANNMRRLVYKERSREINQLEEAILRTQEQVMELEEKTFKKQEELFELKTKLDTTKRKLLQIDIPDEDMAEKLRAEIKRIKEGGELR